MSRLENKFRGYSLDALYHTLRDINETLAIWREHGMTEYVAKLYAEYDDVHAEISRIRKAAR